MIVLDKNRTIFVNLTNIFKNMCVDVDINFKYTGVSIKIIHPSNICILVIELDKDMFDEYEIEKEQIYTIKTDLLYKICKKVGKKKFSIKLNDTGMEIKNEKVSFELNYFVTSNAGRNIPEYQNENVWNVNAEDLFQQITELQVFSEIGKFVSGDKLSIETKEHMIKGNTIIDGIQIKNNNDFVYYDLTYLNLIKDIPSMFENVTVSFSRNNPIIISGTTDIYNFKFILAARQDDNE